LGWAARVTSGAGRRPAVVGRGPGRLVWAKGDEMSPGWGEANDELAKIGTRKIPATTRADVAAHRQWAMMR